MMSPQKPCSSRRKERGQPGDRGPVAGATIVKKSVVTPHLGYSVMDRLVVARKLADLVLPVRNGFKSHGRLVCR